MGTEGILIAFAVMGAVGAMVARKGQTGQVAAPQRSDINMFSDYGDESLPGEYYSALAAVERAVKEQSGTTVSASPILTRRAATRAASTTAPVAAFGKRATH